MLIKPAKMYDYTQAIRRAHQSFVSTQPFRFTDEEFITAFIEPNHIEPLTTAHELTGNIGRNHIHCSYMFDAMPISVGVSFDRYAPIIIPRYVDKGFQPTAPIAFLDRFYEHVKWRWEMNCLFGDAIDGLQMLNPMCEDWRSLRAVFPAITTLLKSVSQGDENSAAYKRAVSLENNKSVNTLPRLPREVKERLIEASNILLASTLVGDVAKAPGTGTLSPSFSKGRSNFFLPGLEGTNCS